MVMSLAASTHRNVAFKLKGSRILQSGCGWVILLGLIIHRVVTVASALCDPGSHGSPGLGLLLPAKACRAPSFLTAASSGNVYRHSRHI